MNHEIRWNQQRFDDLTGTIFAGHHQPLKVWILCLYSLLLDSRVVDVPRAYNRTFVMRSSLKPFFCNSLQKELRFSNNAGA